MTSKQLKLGDIRKNFSSTYYSRGREYQRQGQVTAMEITDESQHHVSLFTNTRGSGHRRYQQSIEIIWYDGEVDILGHCSCPVSINCKHVVAACIEYQAEYAAPQRKQPRTDLCMEWLDEFIDSGIQKNQPPANKEFLLYLLMPTKQPGQITVELLITRHLKRGGFAKGRKAQTGQIANGYYHPEYLQEADIEIIRLLEACPQTGWTSPLTLDQEIGFATLVKIIDSGRCHWLDSTSPSLQWLETRPLSVEWQHDNKGGARLRCTIIGGGALLLTTPALYLDVENNGIGFLSDVNYNHKQLQKLLGSISVPASQLSHFSQKLLTALPKMPPPQAIETLDIKQPPRPRIRLSAVNNQERNIHRFHMDFLYAEHAIPAIPFNDVESIPSGKTLVRVWRDLQHENDALELIEKLGFQGVLDENNKELFFISMGDNSYLEGLPLWQDFITNTLPRLEQQGWIIEQGDSFQLGFHQADEWITEIDSDNDWFDLRFDIEVDGKKHPLLLLISEVLTHYDPNQLPETLTLPLGDSQYLTLGSEQIRPIVDILFELYSNDSLSQDGSLRLSRFDAGRLNELELQSNSEVQWRGGEALRELGKKLNDFAGIQAALPPKGLKAELRDYQQQGLNWLQFLREYQFGGVLADDMGLGKTVQTLAHLLLEKSQGRMDSPCLIIAPTSLMSNWQREAAIFAPTLKVLILQGSDRQQHFDKIEQYDLILSTYPLLVRDEEILMQHHYHFLVLDEAQVIKNPKAKAAQIVRQIQSNHRLCLTGTPMENHLGELWALFDFLIPGFLGDSKQFNKSFRTPIEKHQDSDTQQRLSKRVAPFMLRRTKAEVADELPEKSEIIRSVALDSKQAALYESIRISMEKKVRDAIASKGLARSHITILDALLKLRQCCCDPQLLKLKQAQAVQSSAKLELLMTLLPEMVEEGRRILLFSSFTQMLSIIEQQLLKHNISYSKLTGQTRKRDEAIERFKSGQADVFLISLKAGGVGLNLTEADTVIHYDPWWNPAAENQATDRAHRIGQKKAVFVYKLITENTLEEKILAMQAKKQALVDGVYRKGKATEQALFSNEDLQALFSPL